jgi:glyoxylase-like metal-dependent hydrolase (beta-lactamase superfamily II)
MPAKITVGNVEITSLLDTPMNFPWAAFFPAIDQSEFEPYRDLYPDSFHPGGNFQTFAQCFALRSGGKVVLVDTGVGPAMNGKLLEDMNNKGFPPETVDVVVFTHLHADHVGWNLTPDKVPAFPKARYLVPQGDWDVFTRPEAAAQNPHIAQLVIPLEGLSIMDLFSGEHPVTDEVTTLPTPGHTPGHASLVVASAGEKAIITGDLAHHPAQVDRTDWCSGFDGDRDGAVASRTRVFDQIENEGLVACICHFPSAGLGRLVRADGKRVFQAL